MSVSAVKEYLKAFGADDRVITFTDSSATVALAAERLGCSEGEIAKTLSFYGEDGEALIVVAAGDAKVNNGKFKSRFGYKPKMLMGEDVQRLTGFAPGGVCPFNVGGYGFKVWLDESLLRYTTVYPAAGDAASAVRLTPQELFSWAKADGWVDVCRLPETLE